MKAWNYIKNDCDQETGKEYSTILQIIVKDDRGKAIAWRLVSCKMTCYHVQTKKKGTFLVCILYPVCSLHFVPSLHIVPGLQSAFCTDRIGIAVFVRASLKSGPKYWSSKNILVRLSWPLWLICGLYVEELTRKSTMIEQWLLYTLWLIGFACVRRMFHFSYLWMKVLYSMECLLYLSEHNRYELYLMILHFDCVNPWKKCIICRCFWKNIIRYRNINNNIFSFIYLIQWKKP